MAWAFGHCRVDGMQEQGWGEEGAAQAALSFPLPSRPSGSSRIQLPGPGVGAGGGADLHGGFLGTLLRGPVPRHHPVDRDGPFEVLQAALPAHVGPSGCGGRGRGRRVCERLWPCRCDCLSVCGGESACVCLCVCVCRWRDL